MHSYFKNTVLVIILSIEFPRERKSHRTLFEGIRWPSLLDLLHLGPLIKRCQVCVKYITSAILGKAMI